MEADHAAGYAQTPFAPGPRDRELSRVDGAGGEARLFQRLLSQVGERFAGIFVGAELDNANIAPRAVDANARFEPEILERFDGA